MNKLIISILITLLCQGLVAQDLENIVLKEAGSGTQYELAKLRSAKASAIIFWGNRCAYNAYYVDRIKLLANEFTNSGVLFILVNANRNKVVVEESPENMKKYMQSNQLNLPYLVDASQLLKQSLGATRSPEVYLLDNKLTVIYSGAIDDNPQSEGDVSHHYLREAILSLMSDKQPAVTRTRPTGCLIR